MDASRSPSAKTNIKRKTIKKGSALFLEYSIILSFLFCIAALLSAQIRKWADFVDCSEFVIAHFNWTSMKCDPSQK